MHKPSSHQASKLASRVASVVLAKNHVQNTGQIDLSIASVKRTDD